MNDMVLILLKLGRTIGPIDNIIPAIKVDVNDFRWAREHVRKRPVWKSNSRLPPYSHYPTEGLMMSKHYVKMAQPSTVALYTNLIFLSRNDPIRRERSVTPVLYCGGG
jgi:hypothetical protein